jgi:hypothetical protein
MDSMKGYSQAFQHHPDDSHSLAYISKIRAHTRTYSNDPGNFPSGGWQLKEEDRQEALAYWKAETRWVAVGGRYESGSWSCNLPGAPGLYTCYATTQHSFEDAILNEPRIIRGYYTSDSGQYSSESCWLFPNCTGGGGGGGAR